MKENSSFYKKNFWVILYIVIITVLLYARDIIGIPINKYVFIGICFMFSATASYKQLIPIITFTLPLMCGLPGNFLLPIWCFLVLWNQIRGKTININAIGFVVLFAIWELTLICFYPNSIPIINLIGYICALLLLSLLVAEKGAMDYTLAIQTFIVGCSVLLLCSYLIYIQNPSLMVLDNGVRMGGDTYAEEGVMSLHTNANNIGFLSAVAISFALSLFYYKKLAFIPFLILVSICFFCGLFAVSRTWALSVVFCIIFYFIFQRENKKVGYAILIALVGLMFCFLSKNDAILNVFIERFTGDDIETGGQRTTLFSLYNAFLLEHPINLLFGTGAQQYKEVTGIFNSTHNGLQQIWLSYGIIGFLIFMLCYIKLLKKFYSQKQYMAFMPMAITFIYLQTIQVLNPHNGLYPIIVSFFMMRIIQRSNNLVSNE